MRSSESNATSLPSSQRSYKSGLCHACESAMVQRAGVENITPYVLHISDLNIIVKYGNGLFSNITTRCLVSTNNTENDGISSHFIYLNLYIMHVSRVEDIPPRSMSCEKT
jgi:hypothetical protein